MKWTSENVAALTRMHAAGEPYWLIGVTLGTTKGAIAKQCEKRGLKRSPHWKRSRALKFSRLRAKKKSFGQIAAELGISRNAVAGRVWREKQKHAAARAAA